MLLHWITFLTAGFLAGVINAIAGGGSLIIFPLLVSQGIPAIMANATTTFVVQPGTISSAYGYRKTLRTVPRRYLWLLLPAFFGSIGGAILLKRTSNVDFGHIVPFFILFAVGLMLLQSRLHHWIFGKRGKALEHRYPVVVFCIVFVLFFLIGVYGGYFGAGYGIMALALLGLTKLKTIHQMNGLKNLIAISFGTAAMGYYVLNHLVNWSVLPLLICGNIVGGYVGATYSTKLPTKTVRTVVIGIGAVVCIFLFKKYYFAG